MPGPTHDRDPQAITVRSEVLREMIRKHVEYTGSRRGASILSSWETMVRKFVKVYPNDYRRVTETQKRMRKAGLSEEEAVMAAFDENAHDLARVGGS